MNHARSLHQRGSILYLTIAGVGLILLGAAAFILLTQPVAGKNNAGRVLTIPAAVDFPAPALSLTDLDGNGVSLAERSGQVVLVNLWATWCPPCKKEMPALEAYFQQHGEQGFVIVGINDGDPTADVKEFVSDYRLTFPIWLDPTYIATEKAFQTLNLPSSFVIDRKGIVRLRWVGEATVDMLEQYVTPIITE